MRLIDADALGVGEANRDVFIVPEYADGWNSAIKMIKNAPTVDAVPVKHGKWLETDSAPHRVYCSKCYKTFVNNKNWLKSNGGSIDDAEYCPHCCAKMDEVSK